MPDLEQLAARMFCVGFEGFEVSDEMQRLINRGISGAVLFKRNFQSGQQLSDLCASLKTRAGRPFLTSVDQEGGRVVRLIEPFLQIPDMRSVGRSETPQSAQAIAHHVGRELRAANIDMNFAPVLDVDTNPANPVIGDRSFGSTPELVSRMGAAWIAGLQSAGIAACGKHFPGHGDTSQDSHLELPRLPHDLSRLEKIELPPFAAAARAGVAAIMTAHVIFEAIDPAVPATMSRAVLTGLLRERFGFQGVIISDDLEMKAIANHYPLADVIVRGIHAGVDLFLICRTAKMQHAAIDAVIEGVRSGNISRGQLETADARRKILFDTFVRDPESGLLSERMGFEDRSGIAKPASGKMPGADPTARDE